MKKYILGLTIIAAYPSLFADQSSLMFRVNESNLASDEKVIFRGDARNVLSCVTTNSIHSGQVSVLATQKLGINRIYVDGALKESCEGNIASSIDSALTNQSIWSSEVIENMVDADIITAFNTIGIGSCKVDKSKVQIILQEKMKSVSNKATAIKELAKEQSCGNMAAYNQNNDVKKSSLKILFANKMGAEALLKGDYRKEDLLAKKFSVAKLRALFPELTAKDFASAKYNASELTSFSMQELVDAGFTVNDLTKPQFSNGRFQPIFNLTQLKEVFSFAQIRDADEAPWATDEYLDAGFTAQEMIAGNADIRSIWMYFRLDGKRLADVISAKEVVALDKKIDIWDLNQYGYTAEELKDAGFSSTDIAKLVVTNDLSVEKLKSMYSTRELLATVENHVHTAISRYSLTAAELKTAGVGIKELILNFKNQGALAGLFTHEEILEAYPELRTSQASYVEVSTLRDVVRAFDLSLQDLKAMNINAILVAKSSNSTLSYARLKMKEAGFSTKEIISTFSIILNDNTSTLTADKIEELLFELRYSVKELLAAGVNKNDIIRSAHIAHGRMFAGEKNMISDYERIIKPNFTIAELRAAGLTINTLKYNYTTKELREGGVSIKDLIVAKFNKNK